MVWRKPRLAEISTIAVLEIRKKFTVFEFQRCLFRLKAYFCTESVRLHLQQTGGICSFVFRVTPCCVQKHPLCPGKGALTSHHQRKGTENVTSPSETSDRDEVCEALVTVPSHWLRVSYTTHLHPTAAASLAALKNRWSGTKESMTNPIN